MIDENKPFMEMSKLELRETFDELGLDLNEGMLNDARSSAEESRTFTLSIVMLRMTKKSDGSPFDGLRILHWNPEYGDDEGRSSMEDYVKELRRSKLLREGETVERYLGKISLDEFGKFVLSLDEVRTIKKRRHK